MDTPTIEQLQAAIADLQKQNEALKNPPRKNILVSLFGVNWRTSLVGWMEGATVVSGDLLDAYKAGTFNTTHGIALGVAVLLVIKGTLSKDKVVTGGVVANDIKPAA